MTTHILRHGETRHSREYVVNGDPKRPVPLSEEGLKSCGLAWHLLPLHQVATWLSSEFPRARQTASRLMAVPETDLVVDRRLNELDYGDFEGGPFLEYAAWLEHNGGCRRPLRASESQREGIRRMLTGLRAVVEHPGPRVVVCHGLLVSVLRWHRVRSSGDPMPLFFPEAPYVEPMSFGDKELLDCVKTLLAGLAAEGETDAGARADGHVSRRESGRGVATFDQVSHPHAQRDIPHA
jgi:probable phosphoglycerate mutase